MNSKIMKVIFENGMKRSNILILIKIALFLFDKTIN